MITCVSDVITASCRRTRGGRTVCHADAAVATRAQTATPKAASATSASARATHVSVREKLVRANRAERALRRARAFASALGESRGVGVSVNRSVANAATAAAQRDASSHIAAPASAAARRTSGGGSAGGVSTDAPAASSAAARKACAQA